VDSKGFVYLGNAVNGIGNVRKYDPKTGQMLAELPHVPDAQPGGGGGDAAPAAHVPGHGCGPVAGLSRLLAVADAVSWIPRLRRPVRRR